MNAPRVGARGRPTKRETFLHDEARSKIQTTQLINRLQDHALGKIKMSKTQIDATKILLGKKLPDLATISLGGDPLAEPIRFVIEGL